jgi:hypothetical protein
VPVLVAIEVTPLEPEQAPWVTSMLEACNAASEAGDCVHAGADAPSTRTAQVTWEGQSRAIVVLRDHRKGELARRVLQFQDSDEPRETWRTVGFTAALLAGGHSPNEGDASTEVAKRAVAPAPLRWAAETFHWAATARFLAASGTSDHSPKWGAQLRVDGRAWQAPWLVGVSAEHTAATWSAPGVEGNVMWSEVGIGVASLWELADDVQLFTRGDLIGQRLKVIGQRKQERDAVEMWQLGGRLGVELTWGFEPHWYAVMGAHATLVRAPVDVRVGDKQQSRIPAASAGLGAGVQYRF